MDSGPRHYKTSEETRKKLRKYRARYYERHRKEWNRKQREYRAKRRTSDPAYAVHLRQLQEQWRRRHGIGPRPKRRSNAERQAAYRARNLERVRLSNRNYYHRNIEKYRVYQAKRRIESHGITVEQYQGMMAKQGNACAICQRLFADRAQTHIDHSHKTQAVRGLLCHGCNVLLGFVNDDVVVLESAIAYLRKHAIPQA